MSPAYDLTRASNPLVSGMRAASVCGKSVAPGQLDLKKLGESQGVRQIEQTIERVLQAVNDWPTFAEQAGLSAYRIEQVKDEMPGTGI